MDDSQIIHLLQTKLQEEYIQIIHMNLPWQMVFWVKQVVHVEFKSRKMYLLSCLVCS